MRTEFFRWWIVDPRIGSRRLTTAHLSRATAQRRFPGARPDQRSREFRDSQAGDDAEGETLPPKA